MKPLAWLELIVEVKPLYKANIDQRPSKRMVIDVRRDTASIVNADRNRIIEVKKVLGVVVYHGKYNNCSAVTVTDDQI
jgi:hypothetical protein